MWLVPLLVYRSIFISPIFFQHLLHNWQLKRKCFSFNLQSGVSFLIKFWYKSNLHKTWSLCNIIFVIITCFHLKKKFGKEKFSWLPSKNKVAFSEACKFSCQITIFSFSFLLQEKFVKWKQVKITNMILQRPHTMKIYLHSHIWPPPVAIFLALRVWEAFGAS